MDKLITDYHRLLQADESLSSLDSALDLVDSIAASDGNRQRKGWINLCEDARETHATGPSQDMRTGRIEWALTELPERLRQADVPELQYSFLWDGLLLVFHQAFFSLEKVRRKKLLKVFTAFAKSMAPCADSYHVLGLVNSVQGDSQNAAEFFRAALAATHADAHEFMTRLQMAWTNLMEAGMTREAHDLLLDVYPRVLREDIPEVTSLLQETFQAAAAKGRQLVPR